MGLKIRFIKDTQKFKIGEIAEASKKSCESYIKNGYAEYVEVPIQKVKKKHNQKEQTKKEITKEKSNLNLEEQRIIESQYYSLKSELEGGFSKMVNSFKNQEGLYLEELTNELIKNLSPIPIFQKDPKLYLRWAKGKNDIIKKEKLMQELKDKIYQWSLDWDKDRLKVLKEIKETSNKGFTLSDIKSVVELEVKKRKDREKEIEKLEKKKQIKEKIDKSKLDGIKEEVLTLLLLKRKDKASELIVEEIKKNNYIYTTKDDIKPEIWIYKDGIYIPQGKSEIEKQVRNLLGEAFTINLSNEILHKIKADTQIELDEFFKTNYIDEIPVENGILNIFTRELKPFDPKKIFFNKIPIKYNPKATCPTILKFFLDVLKHETDIQVILELFGFAMLKEYRFEKAFMFMGTGRNGKSKTLELLKRMLGLENCCSVPLSMITADSTSVCELFGKMVNLAGDLNNESLKKTGMFKQTVGRDLIAAKRKYLRDLPFVNYAKHIFACNELPRVYDLSDGFWTKWVLLEFPYKFIPQKEFDLLSEEERKDKKILDTDIIEKITTPEEMSGLLNISLDSLKNLIKNKDFSYSIGTSEIKNFWIRQSDSFTAFCMDCIEEDYNGKVSQKKLRKEYNFYCKRNKLKGCGDRSIKATLEDRYGVVIIQDWEDKQRYWEGIRLKNE